MLSHCRSVVDGRDERGKDRKKGGRWEVGGNLQLCDLTVSTSHFDILWWRHCYLISAYLFPMSSLLVRYIFPSSITIHSRYFLLTLLILVIYLQVSEFCI